MESESSNHPEFLILDSSPQPGDGLDYDRKAAQAAMEGKPFVLLFGCAGDQSGRAGLLPSYRSREAVVCYVDIVNCRNKSLRSYMQMIGLEEGGDPSERLNGTAQIFTVSRNQSGGLILHSTGSPTFNVRENCQALNDQLRVIRALLSPGEQDQHIEMTPLPTADDFPSVAAMPPPELSFAPPSPTKALLEAPAALPAAIPLEAAADFAAEPEIDDPGSEEFRRKIEEFAKQWTEIHQSALDSSNPNVAAADPTTTE